MYGSTQGHALGCPVPPVSELTDELLEKGHAAETMDSGTALRRIVRVLLRSPADLLFARSISHVMHCFKMNKDTGKNRSKAALSDTYDSRPSTWKSLELIQMILLTPGEPDDRKFAHIASRRIMKTKDAKKALTAKRRTLGKFSLRVLPKNRLEVIAQMEAQVVLRYKQNKSNRSYDVCEPCRSKDFPCTPMTDSKGCTFCELGGVDCKTLVSEVSAAASPLSPSTAGKSAPPSGADYPVFLRWHNITSSPSHTSSSTEGSGSFSVAGYPEESSYGAFPQLEFVNYGIAEGLTSVARALPDLRHEYLFTEAVEPKAMQPCSLCWLDSLSGEDRCYCPTNEMLSPQERGFESGMAFSSLRYEPSTTIYCQCPPIFAIGFRTGAYIGAPFRHGMKKGIWQ
ncbi:hypothetical protein DFP72DRAFT_861617 [Ephemerocybe angulata]|uniref:Uncharacterized protein n=1 Tax=Ephemerocybe angulata TaxID=980116 RepID=A0A8H6H7A5_9AGAR|nr:hypothetical protein DFP72DRAFT_861617 [Tulosesus angulatus]